MQKNQSQQLNKKEERIQHTERKHIIKRVTQIAVGVLIFGGIGMLIWYAGSRASVPESEIISRKGIHWHPELKIIIKDEEIAIPANVGIGMQYAGHQQYDSMMMMTDVHTHDNSGTLHWEVMEGPVKKDDVRLANFFSIWGRKFDNSCIFEFCNESAGTVKMFVNGQLNTEFQNYLVKDKDKIEIRYELK